MKTTVVRQIASTLEARINCTKSGNTEWFQRHTDALAELVRAHLPSGSGFDSGTRLLLDASTPDKLVFRADFHHMDENGHYDGWTEHKITATPSFAHGIELSISGRNRNEIKEYAHEVFHAALTAELNTGS